MDVCPHCNRALEVEPDADPPDEKAQLAGRIDDPDLRQAILDAIEAGNRPIVAAAQQSVDSSLWYRWKRRADDQRKRRVRGKYRAFFDEVELAELKAEGRCVDIVANGAVDDPRLAMDFLKLRFSAHWQQQIAVVVETDRQKILEVLLNEFSDTPEILERFFRALAGLVGAGATGLGPTTPVVDSRPVLALAPESETPARSAGLDPADEPGVDGPKTP